MDSLKSSKPSLIDKFRLYRFYILLIVIIILSIIYLYMILFGNKSVMVLIDLREQEKELNDSIKFYQRQNAYLQKEIFEIRGNSNVK